MKRSLFLCLACVVIVAWSATLAGAGHKVYSIEMLPGLTEPFNGYAFRINNHGQIVGCATDSNGQTHAVLWDRKANGGFRVVDLGTLGGGYSCAQGINDRGDVVGESSSDTLATYAFLWRDGKMINLGSLLALPLSPSGSYELSGARSINNRGQIVGFSAVDDGGYRGFLWEHGEMVDLGSLGPAGDERSQAFDINNHGQFIGWSITGLGQAGAVVWRKNEIIALGNYTYEARSINKRGQIVGQLAGPTGTGAFLWQAGNVTEFGGESSVALGVNDHGQVVGYGISRMDPETGEQFLGGFLWKEGVLKTLPQPPESHDSFAYSINNHGWIVGHITSPDGCSLPVLWKSGKDE